MRHRILQGFLSTKEREQLCALGASEGGWLPGRQATGYEKLVIAPAGPLAALYARSREALGEPDPLGWDCYLLRYQAGAFVPRHLDPPLGPGLRHLRLNALAQPAAAGGALSLDGEPIPLAAGDAVIFRPDEQWHEVSPVEGLRLVWSVGCNY